MKIINKKGFVFLIILLTTLFSSYSIDTNQNEAYWDFDSNSFSDLSGNGHTATNGGTTNTSGIIIDGRLFSGAEDVDLYDVIYTGDFTLNIWVLRSGAGTGDPIVYRHSGTDRVQILDNGGTNDIRWNIVGSSTNFDRVTGVSFDSNTWNMLTLTRNANNFSLYKNGTLIDTVISAVGTINPTDIARLGSTGSGSFWVGKEDEVSIWNVALDSTNITELLTGNGGNPLNPYTSTTPQIETNLSSYYPINNISIQLNTTTNVNMSYILDSENETFICSDCNNSIVNLTDLAEGNHNITWISKDIDGNNTNFQTFLIDELQYFRFYNNLTSTYLTDFSFGGVLSVGEYVSIPFTDLNLGSNSLEFIKTGFESENYTFNLTSTTQLNLTFNVSPVTLSLIVFDEFNPSTQLTFNVTIINATNSTIYLNQVNFSINYNESLKGNLTFVVESDGYLSRNFYTSLSPFSSITQILYLIPISDADQVIFRTINSLDSQPVADSTLNFYRYINGTKTFLGQAQTDGNGFTSFNLDSTLIYEVLLTSDGFITQIFNTLPNTLTYTIILNPEGILVNWLFEDFSYKFIPTNSVIDSFPINLSVIYVDDDNLITNAIFSVVSDSYSYSTSSTSPSGTTLTLLVDNESTTYQATLTVLRDGETYTFSKIYNFYNESDYNTTIINLAETLDNDSNDSDRVLVIIVGLVIFGGIGAWLGGAMGGAIALFVPLILFAYISWLPIGLSILLMSFIVIGVLVFQR